MHLSLRAVLISILVFGHLWSLVASAQGTRPTKAIKPAVAAKKKKALPVSTKPTRTSTPSPGKSAPPSVAAPVTDNTVKSEKSPEKPSGDTQPEVEAKVVRGPEYGIALSYLSSTMTGQFNFSGTNYLATMNGSGFGLVGTYDRPMAGPFSTRLMVGLEQFSVHEARTTNICGGGTTSLCSMELINLSVYGQGQVIVVPSKNPIWVAGGIGGWLALSKKSTVFEPSSIGPLMVFLLSAGVDVHLFGSEIPVCVDYVMLSGTASVTGSSWIARLGYKFK